MQVENDCLEGAAIAVGIGNMPHFVTDISKATLELIFQRLRIENEEKEIRTPISDHRITRAHCHVLAAVPLTVEAKAGLPRVQPLVPVVVLVGSGTTCDED